MMKRTVVLLAVAMLTLSACASGATPTPAPTSAALLPTATATATPTATPTPIPTLPPEQVGGLTGVPDPRYSNPELFDLTDPDAPIPQFVHAMRMAGIEVAPEQVVQGLEFEVVTGADGGEYVVGYFNFDPNPNVSAEILEIPIPVLKADNEEGEWRWKNKSPLPLRFFADIDGIKISNLESHYDRSLKDEVLRDFNSWFITWYQKWDLVEQQRDQEDYRLLDKYVNIALRNDIEPLGGPIIYFYEIPEWVKNNLSDAELEEEIRERVHSLASRYKGKINYWIVVNEYHATPYEPDYLYERLGFRYVEIAFDEARKANPTAVLIYNDNANESPNGHWFRQTYNVAKHLKEKGLIDAIGMQMHLNQPNWTGVPSEEEFRQAIRKFRELGLEVYITEMDVGLTEHAGPDRYLYQAEVYYNIIKTYLEETQGQKAQIISFFGLRDNESWYVELNLAPENIDPLLFDKNGKPKLAYYAVLGLLFQQTDR